VTARDRNGLKKRKLTDEKKADDSSIKKMEVERYKKNS
jgi:hypothetical protein